MIKITIHSFSLYPQKPSRLPTTHILTASPKGWLARMPIALSPPLYIKLQKWFYSVLKLLNLMFNVYYYGYNLMEIICSIQSDVVMMMHDYDP
ncbi:hypothetical protein SFRURICE_007484, partial [Spodoptera frugiperda]